MNRKDISIGLDGWFNFSYTKGFPVFESVKRVAKISVGYRVELAEDIPLVESLSGFKREGD